MAILLINGLERCLVTGANGFVGEKLVRVLSQNSFRVSLTVRQVFKAVDSTAIFLVGDINEETVWREAIANQDVIIHLANRAHVLKDSSLNPLAEYRKVNVAGTLALARQASEAGVKRFIYLSSIKVNGERTADKPFRYNDSPAPEDDYAISKWEAEQGLIELCSRVDMELVVIRSPLIYGKGVKGNLRSLTQVIDKGWPLPLAGIGNQRDLMGLGNLVDLIATCISHPKAAGQTFLCSDDQPLSTSELVQFIAKARNKRPRLFTIPRYIFNAAGRCLGKKSLCDRLLGDLQIDIEHTKRQLGWSPKYSVEEGMARAFEINNEQVC